MSTLSLWIRQLLAPLIVFAILLGLWEAIVWKFQIPKILLPAPSQVWAATVKQSDLLVMGFGITALAAFIALCVCGGLGLLIAMLFSQSSWLRRAFFPYVLFLQTVPIIAIAPLLIIWSGNNFRTVILVAIIIGLFPVVSNTTSSLLVVSRVHAELFQIVGASRWQTLWKLRLPNAIPAWSMGLRISAGLVVIGAIVGEFFVGNSGQYAGLGALITRWQGRQETASLIAAVAATTLLGLAFFFATYLITRVFLRKWTRLRL